MEIHPQEYQFVSLFGLFDCLFIRSFVCPSVSSIYLFPKKSQYLYVSIAAQRNESHTIIWSQKMD